MSKNNKNTLLWEIKGTAIQSPSYLFGTMHVQDERAFKGIEFLENCIASCEAFAAEYDLETEDATAFERVAMLPEGKTIEDYVSGTVYKKLAKVFRRETGYDLEQFKRHKPVMLVNLLSVAQFSEDHQTSLDMHLHNFAKASDKTLLGLESFESQLYVMEQMPVKDQLKSLKEIATHFERFQRNLTKTTKLYVEGDLNKMLKKVKETAGGMRKLLIYDRNKVMADRIEQLASFNSLFAAVGAGHLAGKKGVLRLLKKRGLEVTPIHYRD